MAKGYAPLDPKTGLPYQLHHINQANNGTLAILNESEHQGNSVILNIAEKNLKSDEWNLQLLEKRFGNHLQNSQVNNKKGCFKMNIVEK